MTPGTATPKPETLQFLHWCQNWLRGEGYEIEEKLPWRSWRYSTPTIIYALNERGEGAFGLLCHLTNMGDLVLRMGRFMRTTPRPRCIYIFVPKNSPHEVHGNLKGDFSYDIHIVQGPSYPYPSKYFESEVWGSTFSITLSQRESEPKE